MQDCQKELLDEGTVGFLYLPCFSLKFISVRRKVYVRSVKKRYIPYSLNCKPQL
jgi:hypothetical protein